MRSRLSPDIEVALLRGVCEGVLKPLAVNEKELSPEGLVAFRSIVRLLNGHDQVNPESLRLVDGITSEYIDRITSLDGAVESALNIAREKQVLGSLIDIAGKQLSGGEFNPDELKKVLTAFESTTTLDTMEGGAIEEPEGIPLPGLPLLSEATGGISGFWTIGGEPGLGKTCLAWQIALRYAMTLGRRIIYYDLDSTGLRWLRYRTYMMCNKDQNEANKYLALVHHRPSIMTLEDDLRKVKPPTLIVTDSLQKLPTKVGMRRESLDRWLVRLQEKVGEGYDVLAVSEKNRESYDRPPSMSDYKESGEIEYACSTGIMLTGDPDEDNPTIAVHIVKNRHRSKKGRVCYLVRDPVRVWSFIERETKPVQGDTQTEQAF